MSDDPKPLTEMEAQRLSDLQAKEDLTKAEEARLAALQAKRDDHAASQDRARDPDFSPEEIAALKAKLAAPDYAAAVAALATGFDAMARAIEHTAALVPQLGGMGFLIATMNEAVEKARAALAPK